MSHLKLYLTYCHGTENYFLLVDFLTHHSNFTEKEYKNFTVDVIASLKQLKIDGILYLLPSGKADARMRIFNSDGSEAEMCGNGFRCIGKKFWQITGKSKYEIETLSGIIKGRKTTDIYPEIDTYNVLFSNVKFTYKNKKFENSPIPELSPYLKFTTVDIGNPHLISKVVDFELDKLIDIGKKVNNGCKLFPEGNNISFYKITEKNQIFVITYERGVGLTASCGTAMTATAALAARNKEVSFDKIINVFSPGGMVQCVIENNKNLSVKLSGNATFENLLLLLYDNKNRKVVDFQQIERYDTEINKYNSFKSFIKKLNIS